jgi:hypothetical protein
MSEEEENDKITKKEAAKAIDDAMFHALKDFCIEKYRQIICDRIESLEKQKKFFIIVTKDGNEIIANHYDSTSRDEEKLRVFTDGHPVARIKYETIEDVYEF